MKTVIWINKTYKSTLHWNYVYNKTLLLRDERTKRFALACGEPLRVLLLYECQLVT